MPKKPVPSYLLHRPSGQAYVRVNGRFTYLGVYDTAESRERYAAIVAELAVKPAAAIAITPGQGLTILELVAGYLQHCRAYYVKDGRPTSEQGEYKSVIRLLRDHYGHEPAAAFGPLALKALREVMLASGLSRGVINHRIARIKRIFKWAVAEQLVPPSTCHALAAVEGLKQGRTEARETAPVAPVADEVVDATLPHLPPVVADMVRVQRYTGCRPGEVCGLRPMDVDRNGPVWEYRPASHKTQHHGRERVIFIGPKAQEVLLGYLLRPADAYCFSPAESVTK